MKLPLRRPRPDLAVVAPARNEQDNIAPLFQEVDAAMTSHGIHYALVIVDDGSDDQTPHELARLSQRHDTLIVETFSHPRGTSAALFAGIHATDAPWLATLDADLQNDPADLPRLLELLRSQQADLVQGDRSANRRDHAARLLASAVGRHARHLIVGDPTRDTGCATRVMSAALARSLPLDRPGMHRFIPAIARGRGFGVLETPVNHRPRHAGRTKYGTGVFKRGIPGLKDCFYVRRLIRAHKRRPAGSIA